MVSLALILMTLPSRVAEIRAERVNRAGLVRLSPLRESCRRSKNRRLAQAPLQPETTAATTEER
jgi:hypothetical protein